MAGWESVIMSKDKWRAIRQGRVRWSVLDEEDRTVADVYGTAFGETRAALMSAAPDLLAACKMALDPVYQAGGQFTHPEILRAAIAKAEGR